MYGNGPDPPPPLRERQHVWFGKLPNQRVCRDSLNCQYCADSHKRNEFPYSLKTGFLTNESPRKSRCKMEPSWQCIWSCLSLINYHNSQSSLFVPHKRQETEIELLNRVDNRKWKLFTCKTRQNNWPVQKILPKARWGSLKFPVKEWKLWCRKQISSKSHNGNRYLPETDSYRKHILSGNGTRSLWRNPARLEYVRISHRNFEEWWITKVLPFE